MKTAKCNHPGFDNQPTGYLARHEWAEKMAKIYDQFKCPVCGKWAIWKRKIKEG